ncbi:MAG: hypothetical protein QY307_01900 [Acidimicrobiia bacterium]|nr:MAG: hypothetical protein QY307_01900 [Acidimicrobiia bacterium]
MDEHHQGHEIGDATRRGLQRAGLHFMKAAIEVVAGVSAFLEEIGSAPAHDDAQEEGSGPQHIDVE